MRSSSAQGNAAQAVVGARYLSSSGIAPVTVTLEALHAYRDAIINDRIRANPEQAWDHFLWAWNRAAERYPGFWPQLIIPRPVKRDIYVYPFAYFPASFEEDVAAYGRRLENVDFDDNGPSRPARPATIKTRTRQLRTAASALARSGVDAQAIKASPS